MMIQEKLWDDMFIILYIWDYFLTFNEVQKLKKPAQNFKYFLILWNFVSSFYIYFIYRVTHLVVYRLSQLFCVWLVVQFSLRVQLLCSYKFINLLSLLLIFKSPWT